VQAKDRDFVWFSAMDHLIQIGGADLCSSPFHTSQFRWRGDRSLSDAGSFRGR
jgi:hypothetical protein